MASIKRRIWLRDFPTQGGCLLEARASSSEVSKVSSTVHKNVSAYESCLLMSTCWRCHQELFDNSSLVLLYTSQAPVNTLFYKVIAKLKLF